MNKLYDKIKVGSLIIFPDSPIGTCWGICCSKNERYVKIMWCKSPAPYNNGYKEIVNYSKRDIETGHRTWTIS